MSDTPHPNPPRPCPSLLQRVERRAAEHHIRLVREYGVSDDNNDHIAKRDVRPLGVAPARWIELLKHGVPNAKLRAHLHLLAELLADEMDAETGPPKAA